ncbi:MAG TPA: ribosome silencing factor [Ramlibacter sp.]|nr:ribosome silencing factor [Ramlibacter sp.]
MTQETAAKKDTQRLQRAIIEGLEDVKAQDIKVFNTEHLSPLFERVIVASGTSNRQTKALAASVRDAVRDAGFTKPRIEGEENGEWIIVDCGAAVAHIMQPTIRTYYHLEEIWGEKPVRLKFGAPKPVGAPAPEQAPAAKKKADAPTSLRRSSAVKTAERSAKAADEAAKSAARKAPAKKAGARSAAGARGRAAPSSARAGAARSPAARSAPARGASATPTAPKAPAKTIAKTAVKTAAKTVVVKAPARTAAKSAAKPATRSAVRPAAKKAAPKKPAPKA